MEDRLNRSRAILEAAQRVLARSGPRRLAMSDVAAEAGVSRPTVYRWFPTKELLLAAVTAEEVATFDAGVEAAVAGHRSARARLDAFVRFLVTYGEGPTSMERIDAAPGFALESFRATLAPHAVSLAELLGAALDIVPAVGDGVLTRTEACELFLRVAYSHYLVPHAEPEQLIRTLNGIVGLPEKRALRSAR